MKSYEGEDRFGFGFRDFIFAAAGETVTPGGVLPQDVISQVSDYEIRGVMTSHDRNGFELILYYTVLFSQNDVV